jgi:glucokinase
MSNHAQPAVTLAINIGGTTVKWAVIDDDTQTITGLRQLAAPATPARLGAMLRSMKDELPCQPRRVAIGFPGPISPLGELTSAVTLWPDADLTDFSLPKVVHAVWPSTRVHVINDVSAYGQYLLREGWQDFCVLNIGSGVGAKLYVNGRETTGVNGRGGEIGHWVDAALGADCLCDCGGRGHIGAMSSGRGALRLAQRLSDRDPARWRASMLGRGVDVPATISSEALVAAALSEDEFATQIIADAMRPMGRVAALIHLVIGCERFPLVGGFAEALGPLLPRVLAAHAASHTWSNGFDWSSAFPVLHDEVRLSLLGLHHFGTTHEEVSCPAL